MLPFRRLTVRDQGMSSAKPDWLLKPFQYWVRCVPGPHYWMSGEIVQPDETFGLGAIARQPDAVALRSWAETCLPTPGGNETPLQLMGGWSPTRSAVVAFLSTGSRR